MSLSLPFRPTPWHAWLGVIVNPIRRAGRFLVGRFSGIAGPAAFSFLGSFHVNRKYSLVARGTAGLGGAL